MTVPHVRELFETRFTEGNRRIALVDGERRISYEELAAAVADAAGHLTALGVGQQDRVCLLIPKSLAAIVAILAVLECQAVYVPLDPASPPPRLAHMLRTCGPCWLLADTRSMPLAQHGLAALGGHTVLQGLATIDHYFEIAPSPVTLGRSAAPPLAGRPADPSDSLAYILFTSGSTGRPKGVPIPHRNVIDYVRWSNDSFQVQEGERIACHAPLHFDISVSDLFGSLAAGAELHLVPPSASLTPQTLVAYMRQAELEQWYSVPSVLTAMAARAVLRPRDLPALKRVIWGGEAFPVDALRYWMDMVPHATYTNVYGPTEATVNCSFHRVTAPIAPDLAAVPIGRPIPGRRLLLLDDGLAPVPRGERGILYAGGRGLSPGYWRDVDRTRAAFIDWPPGSGDRYYCTGDVASIDAQGLLHLHGRRDRQVKVRGYRIELDEIAAALGQLSVLAESAVVAVRVGGFEGMRICAACVPKPRLAPEPADLKAALSGLLPTYMLPRRWLLLGRLPRNANGKVDLLMLAREFEGIAKS